MLTAPPTQTLFTLPRLNGGQATYWYSAPDGEFAVSEPDAAPRLLRGEELNILVCQLVVANCETELNLINAVLRKIKLGCFLTA